MLFVIFIVIFLYNCFVFLGFNQKIEVFKDEMKKQTNKIDQIEKKLKEIEKNQNKSYEKEEQDEEEELNEKYKELFGEERLVYNTTQDPYLERKFNFPEKRYSKAIFVSIPSYNDRKISFLAFFL